jgi:hypothetical protein
MKDPFRTVWWTLMQHGHVAGKWNWGVKLTENQEAVYIGDDANHITILKGTNGFHHTQNGVSSNGQHEGYTSIESILERVDYNPSHYNTQIRDALTWLKNNKSSM